jgi:DNA-binding MarR family transcriptional regulator
MPARVDRVRLRLWLRLLAASATIERTVQHRLRREYGTTLPRFDVMAALDRAPEGLSMSELSRRLMVTNGNTTALIARLERDGHVRRTGSPIDRRSVTVTLTPKGRRTFERLAAAHARWIKELLGGIDDEHCGQLSDLLHGLRVEVENSAGLVSRTGMRP